MIEQPQTGHRLLAPFENSCEEPREGQDDPPQTGRHLCIVRKEEENDARRGAHVHVIVWETLEDELRGVAF